MFKFDSRFRSLPCPKVKGLSLLSFILLVFVFHAQSFADWQPPTFVSDTTSEIAVDSPSVLSVNSIGNALAVYVEEGGDESVYRPVYASFYARGIGWVSNEEISEDVVDELQSQFIDQDDPDVELNSSNYGVAVWKARIYDVDIDGYVCGIQGAVRTSGGVWLDQEVISDTLIPLGFDSKSPEVSVNENGLALVVWKQIVNVSDEVEVYASFLSPGGSWTSPIALPGGSFTDVADDLSFVDVQLGPNGNAVVAYLADDGSGNVEVRANYYNQGTMSWSTTQTLDSDLESASLPTVSIDSSGNAVVIWERTDNGVTEVRTAFYQSGSWQTSQTLDANVTPESTPYVVFDPAGNATAIWENNGVIYSSTRLVGETVWSAPEEISEGTGNSLESVQVERSLSVDSEGNVIAIWQDESGNIVSAYRIFGSDWQDPKIVYSPQNGETLSELEIGLADCGFAVALWRNSSVALGEQVQSSAIYNLLTPENLEVTRCLDHFGIQSRYLDILTWDPLPEDCILYYQVYKDGELIARVFPDESLRYVNPLDCEPGTCEYTVTSVNIYCYESHPATVTSR